MPSDHRRSSSDAPGPGEAAARPRRALLSAGGGLTLAALLAACGAGTSPGSGDADPVTAPTGPIANVSQVPVGGGIVAGDLVIVQPTEGEVLAFSRSCPHRHNPVDAPEDGVITCPFHGSQFGLDGSLRHGPATTGLTPVPVTVSGDGTITRA